MNKDISFRSGVECDLCETSSDVVEFEAPPGAFVDICAPCAKKLNQFVEQTAALVASNTAAAKKR